MLIRNGLLTCCFSSSVPQIHYSSCMKLNQVHGIEIRRLTNYLVMKSKKLRRALSSLDVAGGGGGNVSCDAAAASSAIKSN